MQYILLIVDSRSFREYSLKTKNLLCVCLIAYTLNLKSKIYFPDNVKYIITINGHTR